MFSVIFRIFKVLGSLLPLLGALQLVKFTMNDHLAAFGLRIPVWVTEATVIAFTAVFLVSLTALLLGRYRQTAPGFEPSASVPRRSRPARAVANNDFQARYRQRLNALSNYL